MDPISKSIFGSAFPRGPVATTAIAVSHTTTPFITAYPWSGSGFGTKFTDPATLPAGNGFGVAIHPDRNAIVVGHANTPYVTAYTWSASGFGTKFTNPATLPTTIMQGVAFAPDGAMLTTANGPGYAWSGAGFGSVLNSGTAVSGFGRDVAFAPDGATAVFGIASISPYIDARPWSAAGYGTKYANPATLPAGGGLGIDFSPDGANIAIAHESAPYITVYPWSAGFGAKYTNPAISIYGNGNAVAWSPSQTVLAVGYADTVSPYTNNIAAWNWSSSGFGTKFTNPATLLPGPCRDCIFSPDEAFLACVHQNSPYITVYNWSASGFGTKVANPATLPTGDGYGVVFI